MIHMIWKFLLSFLKLGQNLKMLSAATLVLCVRLSLQSSWWGRESWLLCFNCLPDVLKLGQNLKMLIFIVTIRLRLDLAECTVKPVLSGHSKIDKTKVLMTNGSLMKVESIAECSPCILQYFWPALSDNWSWKPFFGLFESGRFRQVLLYKNLECPLSRRWSA